VRCRPETNAHRVPGKLSGPSSAANAYGPRVAVGIEAVGVPHAQTGQDVTGERIRPQDHPWPPPHRHDGRDRWGEGGGRFPRRRRGRQPVGRGLVHRDEHAPQRLQGRGNRTRVGDPDRNAGIAQRLCVLGPVLLRVGQHEVGSQGQHCRDVGPFGATDAGYVQSRRSGAVIGGADKPARPGHRLGERGYQRHHPPRRCRRQDRAEVVLHRPQTSVMRSPAWAL
jgi:hypothetical protein